MNSCRLEATFSVERNAELRHDITGSGSVVVRGEPNPSFSIQHLHIQHLHIQTYFKTLTHQPGNSSASAGHWGRGDEEKASSEPNGEDLKDQRSGSRTLALLSTPPEGSWASWQNPGEAPTGKPSEVWSETYRWALIFKGQLLCWLPNIRSSNSCQVQWLRYTLSFKDIR